MRIPGYALGCLALFALAGIWGCQKALPEPFEENGRWGYRLKDGTIRIKPGYIVAEDFSKEGVAFAADMAAWVCIDDHGKVLLRPFIFDNGPDNFSEGLARFTEGGRMGFFNNKCQAAVPALYDFALPFQDGAAEVCLGCKEIRAGEHMTISGGRWGLIDASGKVLAKLDYPDQEAARKAGLPGPR